MIMLRSTHEKELLKSLEAARGAQKGLLRLQRRYKKLKQDNETLKYLLEEQKVNIELFRAGLHGFSSSKSNASLDK